MPPFFDQLTDRATQADSLLCVGLDPHPGLLSEPTAAAARDFCLRLIDATRDLACAFKPNSAFFEALGPEGWRALKEVIASVPTEIPVILDAKRGDIASTAAAYARSTFERLGAGCVTLSPYLGRDSLVPFLADPERGVLLLCKTSNPSSDELQRLPVGNQPLYLELVRLAAEWAGPEQLGFVVGATDSEALASVRQAAPDRWLLAPGVGPQGADLESALRAGLRRDGLGMVLPVSRAIGAADDPAAVAGQLRGEINRGRDRLQSGEHASRASASLPENAPTGSDDLPRDLADLADELLSSGCVQFGDFELKSGVHSPIYFDLRLLTGRPDLLRRAAAAYRPLLERLTFSRLAAVPYAGLPIGTALSLLVGSPLIYPRREVKHYGTRQAVEGGFKPGETALLIDDLATTAGSKFEAIETLQAAGLEVRDVVVLIDREGGASQALEQRGLRLHAVFALSTLLTYWERTGAVPLQQLEAVRSFLGDG